jgi:uncharacterized membrane protein
MWSSIWAVPSPGSRDGSARVSAERLTAAVPAEAWVACSAGDGAKGRRLYDWTRVELAPPAAGGTARWLLVRRSRSDGELAFYACFGPASTSLLGLVQVRHTPNPPVRQEPPQHLAAGRTRQPPRWMVRAGIGEA